MKKKLLAYGLILMILVTGAGCSYIKGIAPCFVAQMLSEDGVDLKCEDVEVPGEAVAAPAVVSVSEISDDSEGTDRGAFASASAAYLVGPRGFHKYGNLLSNHYINRKYREAKTLKAYRVPNGDGYKTAGG